MKKDIRDILFWLLLAVALGFIILKIAGIIGTPEWINYIPIVTIIFAAGIAYQKLIGFMNTMYRRTDYLKNKIDAFENKPKENEKRIFSLEKQQRLILKLLRKNK